MPWLTIASAPTPARVQRLWFLIARQRGQALARLVVMRHQQSAVFPANRGDLAGNASLPARAVDLAPALGCCIAHAAFCAISGRDSIVQDTSLQPSTPACP